MWKQGTANLTKLCKAMPQLQGKAGVRWGIFHYITNLKRSSVTSEHSLLTPSPKPAENNYQPIEGNGGKENEKVKEKKHKWKR